MKEESNKSRCKKILQLLEVFGLALLLVSNILALITISWWNESWDNHQITLQKNANITLMYALKDIATLQSQSTGEEIRKQTEKIHAQLNGSIIELSDFLHTQNELSDYPRYVIDKWIYISLLILGSVCIIISKAGLILLQNKRSELYGLEYEN